MKEEPQEPYIHHSNSNEESEPKPKTDSTGKKPAAEKQSGSQLSENDCNNSKTRKRKLKIKTREESEPNPKTDSTGKKPAAEKQSGSQLPENDCNNSKTRKRKLKIKTRSSSGTASGQSVPSDTVRPQVDIRLPVAWPDQPGWSYAKHASADGNNPPYQQNINPTRSPDIKTDSNPRPPQHTGSRNNLLSVTSSKLPPLGNLPAKADPDQGPDQKKTGQTAAPLDKLKQWKSYESNNKQTPQNSPSEPETTDNKPRIKHRKTALPPSAQKFMEEQESGNQAGKDKTKRQNRSRQSNTEEKKFRSSQISLLMIAVALVLATMPLWPDSLNLEELNVYWVLTITGFLVTLEILLLPRQKTTRMLSGLLLSLLAAVLTLFIFADRLPPHFQNLIFTYNIFDYLSNNNILAASLLLVFGAIVLNLGFPIMQKIAIPFTIAAAIIVAFIPLPMLFQNPPMTIPANFAESKYLEDWSLSDRGWNFVQWTNQNNKQNRLTLVYFHPSQLNSDDSTNNSVGHQNTLMSYIKERADEQGLGPVSTLSFAPRPENHRYVSFGPDNRTIDALTMESEKKEGHYIILFEVADYSASKSYISEFYQMIKL